MFEITIYTFFFIVAVSILTTLLYYYVKVGVPTRIVLPSYDKELFSVEQNEEHIAYGREMEKAGFAYLGSTVIGRSNGLDIALSFYLQQELGLLGSVATVPGSMEESTYIEMAQRYEDGSSLLVSNADRSLLYPFSELNMYYRFSYVMRVETLVSMIEELREKHKKGLKVLFPERREGMHIIEKAIREASERLYANGLCRPEIDKKGRRRLSARGALMMLIKKTMPGQALWEKLFMRSAKA